MREFDLYEEIGMIISKYRSQLQMSQAELARGICNQSHIAHIEKGTRSPNAIILFHIADKLKIPINILFSPYSFELSEMISNLSLLATSNSSRKKLMEYINFIENNYASLSIKDLLLIEGLKYYSKAVEENSYEASIEKLSSKLEAYSKHHAYINPIEFAVENAINWLHFLAGNIDFSYMKFKEAYYKIPKILAFENYEYISHFFIQISVVSIERENYDLALKYLEEGIEYNKSKAIYTSLPGLIYHKGEVNYLLKKKEEGLELIRDSIKLSHYIYQRPNDFVNYITPRLQKYAIEEIDI